MTRAAPPPWEDVTETKLRLHDWLIEVAQGSLSKDLLSEFNVVAGRPDMSARFWLRHATGHSRADAVCHVLLCIEDYEQLGRGPDAPLTNPSEANGVASSNSIAATDPVRALRPAVRENTKKSDLAELAENTIAASNSSAELLRLEELRRTLREGASATPSDRDVRQLLKLVEQAADQLRKLAPIYERIHAKSSAMLANTRAEFSLKASSYKISALGWKSLLRDASLHLFRSGFSNLRVAELLDGDANDHKLLRRRAKCRKSRLVNSQGGVISGRPEITPPPPKKLD